MARLILLSIAIIFAACEASIFKDQYAALSKKLSLALPRPDDFSPLKVNLHLSLLNIDDVDKSHNSVSLIAYMRVHWFDGELAWDRSAANISSFSLRAENVWRPDIALFNAAAPMKVLGPDEVRVFHNGDMLSVAQVRLTATCDTNGLDSYSGATCHLHLGSWSYSSDLITMRETAGELSINSNFYNEESKYEVLSTSAKREVRNYMCCDFETRDFTYDTQVFTFRFRSKYGGSGKSKANLIRSLLKGN